MVRTAEDVADLAEMCGLRVWPSFVKRLCDTRAEKFYNGGWRGTKTVSTDQDALHYITDFLEVPRRHLVWVTGPDYEQARPDYFNLEEWCRDRLKMQVTSSQAQEGSLSMTLRASQMPGTVDIVTKSAGDPQTLGSVGPDLILACEAGQMSEQARDRLRGRASTHNAPIIWNGTFENDTGKPQFSWFEEESKLYFDFPTPRRKAYSLPIWENLGLFGDCREMIDDDPTLIAFCPNGEHGTGHSGIDPEHPDRIPSTSGVPLHPKVRELYEECRDKPTYWRKYYAGEAVGVLNPVYEWSTVNPEAYLKPMPSELKGVEPAGGSRNVLWLLTAGGMDPGLVHPAALTIGSVAQNGDTWVRRSIKDTTSSADSMWATKAYLTRQYNCHSWGGDPVGTRYNPSYMEITPMTGSLYAREARVKIVNGVAEAGHLFFDSDDPGVVALFREIQQVHRIKRADGQQVYDRRSGEDMAASFEDMMAMLHGQPMLPNLAGKTLAMRAPRRGHAGSGVAPPRYTRARM